MTAVVLAAGLGTRMRSALPKVLHPVCGRPLVAWSVEAARGSGVRRVIVVVSPRNDAIREALPGCEFAVQRRPRGTGDALRAAAPRLREATGAVLVLYGDTPLVRAETLRRLRRARGRRPLAMVAFRSSGGEAYGRVVRDAYGRVVRVVERKDATPAERRIVECNAGVYLADRDFLLGALRALQRSRRTGELYLTDVVARAAACGGVRTVEAGEDELLGVNDRADLARAQRVLARRIVDRHLRAGVTFEDPDATLVEVDVRIGADTRVAAGVELRGATVVGRGCRLDAGSVVVSCRIEDGAHLLPYTVITESVVGPRARVGPFAHLRPGTVLGPDVRVGNFVEAKKARLAAGVKANHLAYLGDADVGARTNVGAGTITCNYDGAAKYRTVIEEDVFIGSDTQLVAPVRVGREAYIGAGSTITRDVPAGALALTRVPQKVVEGYTERRRRRARRAGRGHPR